MVLNMAIDDMRRFSSNILKKLGSIELANDAKIFLKNLF